MIDTGFFVIDASVFNKLFLDETDTVNAKSLFRYAYQNECTLASPHVMFYETLQTALHFQIPFKQFHTFLDQQRQAGMQLIEPSLEVLETAKKIAETGNDKSGYPHLIDSIYHALAIQEKGVFVTADKKHYVKTKHFGHIKLLSDLDLG